MASCLVGNPATATGRIHPVTPGQETPAQAPASVTVIGTVTDLDIETSTITVKSDTGEVVVFPYDDKSQFKRLPLGKTAMADAVPITLAEIELGDRVTAKKRLTPTGSVAPITLMIVMSKGDIAKKQEIERAAWRERGTFGKVTAVDPAKRTITVSQRTREGLKELTIVTNDKTTFRRYAPDSVKFSDAQPSQLAAVRVGDQVRALGKRNEDGTSYEAEQVVFGTFKTLSVTVVSVNAEGREITARDDSGATLTLRITPDSNLKQVPEQGGFFGPPGGQRPGGPPSGPPAGEGPRPGGTGGGTGGGRFMAGGFDPAALIEFLPPLQLSELKPETKLLVLTTEGATPDRVTAITVVKGLDTVFARFARQAGGAAGVGGGGFGGLELGIGLP
ncbi:hypothetical protein [Chloracidobacterium aggregatum]|uniref:hypothetical protein n=1 Tax=Chloracidobacterium aggregatum TaxID=2851959 RepID=UPI001B8CA9BF|nr:hypothetical protein [Chloracidobacterium aggregatum]QUV86221.1 hypothetical protein J8C03_15725 [Chloracidobacterium sp. 2]QUV89334.1 hypothetical protein J8C07_11580 [Chloracidobacterium sp. S]QUV98348.1 hypothetical protein J8C00_15280 [Chloracidobacterium sp. E]